MSIINSLKMNENVNIRLILWGKMDIAIVTQSEILIATKMDQEYQHSILLRKNINLSVTKMNMLLDKLVESGAYNKIMQKYGITP